MGAEVFYTYAEGDTPTKAFQAAQNEATYESGHGGYTGTIAEKNGYITIQIPEDFRPDMKKDSTRVSAYADELINNDDERISDKWGPAGCIAVGSNSYLFFGWASS